MIVSSNGMVNSIGEVAMGVEWVKSNFDGAPARDISIESVGHRGSSYDLCL